MKIIPLLACLVCLSGTSVRATSDPNSIPYLASQEFITATEAEKRWGKEMFSAEKFRKGSQPQRAAMAASSTRAKELLGKRPSEIQALLGDFSGHFWSDTVPTYLIEEGWRESRDTWQLVFLLDENGSTTEVRIHKNCCAARK